MDLIAEFGIASYRRNRFNPISGTYDLKSIEHNRANSVTYMKPVARA